MSAPPSLLLSTALLVAFAAPACHKSKPAPEIPVVDDDAEKDEGGGGGFKGDDGALAGEPGVAQAPPLHLTATASDLADLFAWVKAATTAWNPSDPFDVNAQAPALLLQLGVGPGLWSELDWRGVMAVDAHVPLGDDTEGQELRAYGSLAARNARRVIESIPEGKRPQPLGNGLWELLDGGLRVVLREQPTALEFAFDPRDLDRAAGLVAGVQGGRRLRVVADEVPAGLIDLADLLDVPAESGLGRQLVAVSQGLRQLRGELDVGVGRDLQLQLSADAPFSVLGLATLGPPQVRPTALEERLWGAPVGALSIPWGSASDLHTVLDKRVPLDQIPEPFTAIARDGISSVHTFLDQVEGDVVVALYLAANGKATLVMASGVRDEAASRSALRGAVGAIVRGLESYRELAGGAKDAAFKVTNRESGAALGGGRGDLLTVSVPKSMDQAARSVAYVLNPRGELEIVSGVDGKVAFLAIGGGARDLVGKRPTTTLAADPGLALARTATGGCHFCLSVDPLAASRMQVTLRRDGASDPARAKRDNKLLVELQRVQSPGAIGLGASFTADRGVVGLGAPNALLVPDAATAAKIRKLYDEVWDPVFEGEPEAPAEPERGRKGR